MEGNKYFLPLKNEKRYTPYEFDKLMSHNEDRMDSLGKIIDLDIYNCMMKDRRTPLVLTPQLILDNSNNLNSIRPKINKINFTSQSQHILRNPLKEVSNESFKILNSPSIQRQAHIKEENNMINYNKELQNALNDKFTQFDPEQENNSNWKYDGPSSYNMEKKHFPRMLNNGNYFRNRNNEPIKINRNDFNEDLYNNKNKNDIYPESNLSRRNYNNNNFISQDFQRNRSNNNHIKRIRATPYDEGLNDRNNYGNDRYNNNNDINRYNNYDDENNMEMRNRNFRAFSPNKNKINDNYNEEQKDNSIYTRRGNYNSQLNFPNERYQN